MTAPIKVNLKEGAQIARAIFHERIAKEETARMLEASNPQVTMCLHSDCDCVEHWKSLAEERGKAIRQFLIDCDTQFDYVAELDANTAVEMALYNVTVSDLVALRNAIAGDKSL